MAFNFKSISDTEFHVNSHVISLDSNGNWVARPPIDSPQMQKAVHNYINNLQ